MRARPPERPKSIQGFALTGTAILWMGLIIVLPLVTVLTEAFKGGPAPYLEV